MYVFSTAIDPEGTLCQARDSQNWHGTRSNKAVVGGGELPEGEITCSSQGFVLFFFFIKFISVYAIIVYIYPRCNMIIGLCCKAKQSMTLHQTLFPVCCGYPISEMFHRNKKKRRI